MSLFTVISTMSEMISAIRSPDGVETGLSKTINTITSNKELLDFDGNICKFVNSLSVEPIIITTEAARRSPIYHEVLENKVSVFTSYYLQAFKILTDVYGKDVKFSIGVLNNRNTSMISRLSYFDDLFDISKECLISHEENNSNVNDGMNNKHMKQKGISGLKGFVDKTYEKIGYRFLEVNVRVADKDIIVPISIRPMVIESTISNIVALISPEDYTKSFKHRWREWRSGGLTLAEFLFCGDLVKEYKKNKLKDKDDLINITTDRNIDAIKAVASKGTYKFSRHYNMFLLGNDDVKPINALVKGDIFKPAFREKFLDAGNAIISTVLNDDYERATMMISDLYADTIIPYNRLKNNSKNPDYTQLMQLLLQNKTLQF